MREINLEVKYDGTFRRTPYLRQGETGTSTIYLTLPTEFQGYKYVLVFQPVTGDPISTEELTPDENQIISYVLTAVFTAEIGTIGVELTCYDESDNLVKSAEMSIEVKESLSGAGDVIPTDYVPWYVLAAQKASEAEEDAEYIEYIAGILPFLEPQISAATAINNTLTNTTIPAAQQAEETLQTLVDNSKIGLLENLNTTEKGTLVGSINETKTQINNLDAEKADIIDLNQTNNDVNATNLRIDNLVIPISAENANIEVTDAHNSIIKNKNFASLKDRFEESEQDIKALTTYGDLQLTYDSDGNIASIKEYLNLDLIREKRIDVKENYSTIFSEDNLSNTKDLYQYGYDENGYLTTINTLKVSKSYAPFNYFITNGMMRIFGLAMTLNTNDNFTPLDLDPYSNVAIVVKNTHDCELNLEVFSSANLSTYIHSQFPVAGEHEKINLGYIIVPPKTTLIVDKSILPQINDSYVGLLFKVGRRTVPTEGTVECVFFAQ